MKDKLVREYHCFMLPDYEEEEKFLREKHNAGLAFEKVKSPGFYYFSECEPEDVIYKLDFNPQKEKEEAYLQMYADYGWEYIQEMNGYNYFKKSAAAAETDGEDEIFNDNESKLDMMQRIFRMRHRKASGRRFPFARAAPPSPFLWPWMKRAAPYAG